MAYRSSSVGTGNSATPSTTVPAGAATNDIAIILVSLDNPGGSYAGQWPTGFTQFYNSSLTHDGQRVGLGWKLLNAADTGSYTFGNIGVSSYWVCECVLFSGRHTTNPPVATENPHDTGESNPVSVVATGVTAVQGDDLFYGSAPDQNTSDAGNGHTPPTNFTERQDTENVWTNLACATQDNVNAGATGDITGTFNITTGTSAWNGYLVRIPAAGGAPTSFLPRKNSMRGLIGR